MNSETKEKLEFELIEIGDTLCRMIKAPSYEQEAYSHEYQRLTERQKFLIKILGK